MLELTNKQTQAIDLLTDQTTDYVGYGGAAGGGKAQPLSSTVYTPFGKKKMGDIKVGDVICHPSGANTNVIAIHPQGIKKIYEIEFEDGAKTRCTGDHLWYVWFASEKSKQEDKSGNKGKIQTTEMLIKKIKRRPIIPLCKPINFTLPKNRYYKHSLFDPYVLGVILGDGGVTHRLSFTTADSFIAEEVNRLLPEGYNVNSLKDKYSFSITHNKHNEKGYPINPMYDELKDLGLDCKSEFKFIPEKYMHESSDVRLSIVQGLMDTDGTASTDGKVYFASASEQLVLDMMYLLRSLGYKTTKTFKENDYLGCYILYIQGENKDNLFRLPRKKERVKPFNGGYSEPGRRMTSITEVGYEEAKCITVDNPDGLYITDDFIVTHNSVIGCTWLILLGSELAGAKFFIGRDSIKDTKASVIKTWSEVAKMLNFFDYKFNDVGILFGNGTEVELLDLTFYPYKDPLYDRLGSKEFTAGWIEEAQQVNYLAFEVLKTRVGRWKNNLCKSKILCTFNPKKNWVDSTFYRPFINGKEDKGTRFVYALPKDNHHLPEEYMQRLHELKDEATKQRLLFGNFDYDDDPTALLSFDDITEIWNPKEITDGIKYITADIARYGSDKAVIMLWNDLQIEEVITFDISSTTKQQNAIRALATKHEVPMFRVVVDEDGVGGGVKDSLGCTGFVNNSKAQNKNYSNLKSECGYRLAEVFNQISVKANIKEDIKDIINEELGQLKTYDSDKDGKLKILPKEKIKENIGRSPDYLDNFIMRMYFELKHFKFHIA